MSQTSPAEFDYPFGTPEEPSIGGVKWDGGLHLVAPPQLKGDNEGTLFWRISFDLMWVMANLITILSKATNRPVTFNLNRPQQWVMWNLLDQLSRGEPIRLWCLKGRQFGYSTLFTTILFICTALRGQNSLLLAHLEKPGKSIFRKAEMALKTLPTLELTEEDEDGKETTSQIISLVEPPTGVEKESMLGWLGKGFAAVFRRESAENRDAGVGETYQNIQLTEVPLFADADHTIPGLMPAMSQEPGSIVAGEFTARNEGDFAHKRWIRAVLGKSVYRAVFAAWYWMLKPGCEHTGGCSCYARKRRPTDEPLSPEELDYMEAVKLKGHEFPLTEEGYLIPRLRKLWMAGTPIRMHHIAVGYTLTDEQMLFRRDMIEEFNGDYHKWRREFPATPEEAFQVAGRKLIPSNVMDKMDVHASDPLDGDAGTGEYVSHITHGGKARAKWEPRSDGRVWRWELPQAGVEYLIWCDPSSGTGDDPSGIGVDKVTFQTTETVATFEGYVRPHEAARIMARMGRHYRCGARRNPETKKLEGGQPAWIAYERQGFGEAVLHELLDVLNYRRIFRFTDRNKDNAKRSHDYGFPTLKNTKKAMLLRLARGCYGGNIIVHCRRTLASLRAMQYLDDDDEKIGAPRGQHDDLAMGKGIGFHFAQETRAYRTEPEDVEPAWLRKRRSGMFRATG